MKHFGKQKGVRTRACSKCGGDLGDRYGKQRYCKACHAKNMRENRPKHKELPDAQRKRANARSYANQNLKRGKIFRKPCVICGNKKSEMHHDDYDKPLEVVWMCREHHLKFHRNELTKNELG